MVPCGINSSMVLSWDLHGTSICFFGGFMVLPWRIHGTFIVLPRDFVPWDVHGASMVLYRRRSWGLHGTPNVLSWYFYSTWNSMVLPWDLHGASIVLPRCSHGASMWGMRSHCFHGACMRLPGGVCASIAPTVLRWVVHSASMVVYALPLLGLCFSWRGA